MKTLTFSHSKLIKESLYSLDSAIIGKRLISYSNQLLMYTIYGEEITCHVCDKKFAFIWNALKKGKECTCR